MSIVLQTKKTAFQQLFDLDDQSMISQFPMLLQQNQQNDQ